MDEGHRPPLLQGEHQRPFRSIGVIDRRQWFKVLSDRMPLGVIPDGAKFNRRRNPSARQRIGVSFENYRRLGAQSNADGVGVLRERDLDTTVQHLGHRQPLWRGHLQLARTGDRNPLDRWRFGCAGDRGDEEVQLQGHGLIKSGLTTAGNIAAACGRETLKNFGFPYRHFLKRGGIAGMGDDADLNWVAN